MWRLMSIIIMGILLVGGGLFGLSSIVLSTTSKTDAIREVGEQKKRGEELTALAKRYVYEEVSDTTSRNIMDEIYSLSPQDERQFFNETLVSLQTERRTLTEEEQLGIKVGRAFQARAEELGISRFDLTQEETTKVMIAVGLREPPPQSLVMEGY